MPEVSIEDVVFFSSNYGVNVTQGILRFDAESIKRMLADAFKHWENPYLQDAVCGGYGPLAAHMGRVLPFSRFLVLIEEIRLAEEAAEAKRKSNLRQLKSSDFPYLKDADGKPLCRWCKGPVPSGRRTMCSKECVQELRLRLEGSSYLRSLIFIRDAGKCAECDTVSDRWDADHIVEIADGGAPFDLNNVQTLCRTPCHQNKSVASNAKRPWRSHALAGRGARI